MASIIKNQCGQGLLEAIIAITVIASGIVGVMNLVIANQAGGLESADRLLAANLAREGVEISRNWRDSNWLGRAVWDANLSGNGNDYTAAPIFDKSANSWTMDFAPNDLNHNYARLWREGGVYFQSTQDPPSGASLTAYRRLLYLDPICQDKTIVVSGASCPGANPKIGIRARSEVQWITRGSTHTLTAEERLFNWR